MKYLLARARIILLIAASLAVSSHGFTQENTQAKQGIDTKTAPAANVPDLADIIPLSAELTVRQAVLQNQTKNGLDTATVEKKVEGIQEKTLALAQRFQRLKGSEDFKQNEFLDFRDAIQQELDSLEEISQSLRQAVQQLAEFREEWMTEKKRWNEWQNVLIQERGLDYLKPTFERANETIETALGLVLPQLDELFRLQEKAGSTDAKLKILSNELDGLTTEKRREVLVRDTPPLVSYRFLLQFTSAGLWKAARQGLDEALTPWGRFFSQQGWILFLQGLVSLFVILTIHRNRALLKESQRWRFFGRRSFSVGLFLGYITAALIYEHQGAPTVCKQALSLVGALSLTRLLASLIEASWKKKAIYGLMTVLVLTTLIEMFNLPLPLLRLYMIVVALVAIPFCFRWAKESVRRKERKIYPWGLVLGGLFFAVIVIAEAWGKAPLSFYLLISSMRSVAAALLFALFTYMIRGALEWLFHRAPIQRAASVYSDTASLIRRVALLIDLAIWGLVLVPAVFVIWEKYDSFEQAVEGLLSVGFNLGTQRITLGLLILAAAVFYSSFLLSWLLQNLFLDKVLLKRGVGAGVRISIKRLLHYVLISTGFLLAISSFGFDLTRLTIMLSALGVGIGFGLQSVVNNFVSGLILLFERPVRVGDYIELNGNWCEIKKIGLRATTVQTFDQADVIIPNADLVSNQVTNWTLGNRSARLIIPVGVAYGSDVPLVIETLKACADPYPMVAEKPEPQVLFMSFGESSLDFELRVWVLDVDARLTALSELHEEIDRRFREANIEIAFPQRDLHFRTLDRTVTLESTEQNQDLGEDKKCGDANDASTYQESAD